MTDTKVTGFVDLRDLSRFTFSFGELICIRCNSEVLGYDRMVSGDIDMRVVVIVATDHITECAARP